MLRLSDILHADVICKSDSSLTGKVEDVYFDEFCGKIVYFDISRADGRMLLPFSAAASVADAVVTEDSLALTSPGDADLTVLRSALIGRKIYTANGKSRGTVTDVLFSAKGRVASVVADGTAYSPASFRAFGDVLILKDAVGAKRKTRKPSFPKAEKDYPVSILSAAPPSPPDTRAAADGRSAAVFPVGAGAAAARPSADTRAAADGRSAAVFPVGAGAAAARPSADIRAADDEGDRPVYVSDAAGGIDVIFGGESFTPYRVIADYNFLLGRTLADDLVSYSGETLARRGERVSVETVEKARRHGKLMDLTLSSR